MLVIYAQEDLDKYSKSIWSGSIFLAGPTPRSATEASWRPEAISYLQKRNYKGRVFVPEPQDGSWTEHYDEQVEWEYNALYRAKRIVFWVPRNLITMPAFTTNVEFGYWLGAEPNKVILGYPQEAEKMRYLHKMAEIHEVPIFHTLEETLDKAINE